MAHHALADAVELRLDLSSVLAVAWEFLQVLMMKLIQVPVHPCEGLSQVLKKMPLRLQG